MPDIAVTITEGAIQVEDNGPGLPVDVIRGVMDFSIRVSSKDAYISPTRGAQGNALKTILAIPYVLSDGSPQRDPDHEPGAAPHPHRLARSHRPGARHPTHDDTRHGKNWHLRRGASRHA